MPVSVTVTSNGPVTVDGIISYSFEGKTYPMPALCDGRGEIRRVQRPGPNLGRLYWFVPGGITGRTSRNGTPVTFVGWLDDVNKTPKGQWGINNNNNSAAVIQAVTTSFSDAGQQGGALAKQVAQEVVGSMKAMVFANLNDEEITAIFQTIGELAKARVGKKRKGSPVEFDSKDVTPTPAKMTKKDDQ